MHVLIGEGLVNEPFVRDRTENFEALRDLVRDYPPELAAPICGIDADDDPRRRAAPSAAPER